VVAIIIVCISLHLSIQLTADENFVALSRVGGKSGYINASYIDVRSTPYVSNFIV